MRIHLVTAESPESRRLRGSRLIQFPELTMPLIAALTPREHDIYHTDEIVERPDVDRRADLVGITAPTPSALHAYEVANAFRRRGVPVVIGGPHATALPEEAAKARRRGGGRRGRGHLAAPARGRGGWTARALLPLDPPRQPGRSGGAALGPDQGAPLREVGHDRHPQLPASVRLLHDPLLYGPGTMRYRPVDQVVREVAGSPTRAVVFWDDNIGANPRYSKELFRALAPFGKWWTSQCTATAAKDEEFQRLAAASGCKALFMGFESISQESLDSTNKGHNRVAGYRGLIRSLHAHGIAAHLGIMFGFDQDDRGIFRRTVEFLEEASVDVATMSMIVPMPGTPTFQRWQAQGRILTTDWSKYDGKKHCVFRPARMSPEELVAGTEWASRRFYSLGSIARRMWGSRTGVWWNLPRNLGYRLALGRYPEVGWDPGQG